MNWYHQIAPLSLIACTILMKIKYNIDMDIKSRYASLLEKINDAPEYNRLRAEKHFYLVKDFEERFCAQEKAILGSKFRVDAAIRKYCQDKDIAPTSLYRWLRLFRKKGIKGLVPKYGKLSKAFYRRRKNKLVATIEIYIKNHLNCLKKIKQIISRCTLIEKSEKQLSLKILDDYFFVYRRPRLKLLEPLTEEEISRLKLYRASVHKKNSAKATAILMLNDHHGLLEIVQTVRRRQNTIYRWVKAFNERHLDSIEVKVHAPNREALQKVQADRIIDIIHKTPALFNINRTTWTYGAIVEAYRQSYDEHISIDVIKRIIKRTGYTWRRARIVLTSHDPLYREKITRVVETLRGMTDNEAFFFIDEAGPYRVKKYGGKSLVAPNEKKTIPQYQSSRGKIQFIAALEAKSNQLIWQFTESKDASMMISLIEELVQEYSDRSTLFLTWDAITTHSSHDVVLWIIQHNQEVKTSKAGPIVTAVPLPSNSQFLNVIEAVFSGMKKAVIHNSDYASTEEMKAAISRHFEDRNIFYIENLKRAGNKIWDKELFDVDRLPGGLFKKM